MSAKRLLDYCQEDVDALAWLVPRLVPTVRSLPHAMKRAEFMWATAQQERRGIPLDLPMLNKLSHSLGSDKSGAGRRKG